MTAATPAHTNRLIRETSPYLRQHAHNPVDWYPWGPEALERARQLDRPIFLSIGYSACHWCHVMEHESFENEEIADVLNRHFVSIKVDREERPDLDQIYMTAVQALTQHGGWPMSVFLTPDLKPFHGGTYYPPDDRFGRIGFKRLLLALADAWQTRRSEVNDAADNVTSHVQGLMHLEPADDEPTPDLIRNAVRYLTRAFDAVHGGFGHAPKFPHPMDLRLLLRAWRRFGDSEALRMVRLTLDKMGRGGIYDHLGGGFARYSTDERWLVPHFEKMLYDNALLVPCYLEAFQATGEGFYREIAEETLDCVLREMTSPEGPFYSTQDADSEGVEGKFYVWTPAEIEAVLGPEDAKTFAYVYGVTEEGNWDDPHHPEHSRGKSILNRTRTWEQDARMLGVSVEELRRHVDESRKKLYEVRSRRVWPGRDDKVLTSWNGLMINALAQAAQVLDRPDYAAAAAKAADFLLTRMRTPDGRLLHTWGAGSDPKLNGYLEDYAYLLDALVTLYEATFEPRWVSAARELAGVMKEQFWDETEGGFFYTGKAHEQLIARTKDPNDNATPSANSVAVLALLRLAALTGSAELREPADRTLRVFHGQMAERPFTAAQMLLAADFYLGPVREFAVVGDPAAEDTQRVLRTIRSQFEPGRVVARKRPGDDAADAVIPLLQGKSGGVGVTVYVCENFACREPLRGAAAIEAALRGSPRT